MFPLLFVAVCVLVAVGFVATIALMFRNVRKVRRSGHDPFTLQADLTTRALNSAMLAPARTAEDRLHELDELQHRHVISAEEYVRARERVLSGQ
ncbi:SHOCT domain-containing protein [Subtercola sp. Z020]|uniref:SHOCT domain-containing protein n=1 Tax=Subtercola sp. Z020 TaxID=2080582 RepID=UPI000CE80FD0|nr:SHOCT domain-containing protein [Subtercola sp. Z020]PPF84495.1 SHOCT domain-containing protein [Subtercola sp. Z020]